MTTNITLPTGGVGNMTFLYDVPVGFDDLSAAVSECGWAAVPHA